MGYRVGVDIGGTFADFCAIDEASGQIATVKVLSTPATPGQEVINGLKALEDRFGIQPSDVSYFTHGTTVGVNSIVMRKGINLALFTTENFTDVLELARLRMPDAHDLFSSRPEPLVTPNRIFGVRERILADGTIDTPIDPDSVRACADKARSRGAQGVVISFLHCYKNPAHELEAERILAEYAPDLHVFCSHKVRPIIREYERTSTAVIHGYVQPRVSQYIEALQAALKNIGLVPEPMITKSNGGIMSAEIGKTACVEMLLSGTAAGVMGAAFTARSAGIERVLSLDIGGTSADVAFIENGAPGFGTDELVGEFPIFVPTVSVTSIGEGGGSIARIDNAGMLTVGPESAGSTPGPAAYGRGGTEPTITDAFIALGLIDLGALGYGMVEIDRQKAVAALEPIAKRLGRSVEETSEGIINIAVSSMYREVSKLCSRRGVDIRDFSLMAFGGGGPMMACYLARDLGIRDVLIPPAPGVLSALGGLTADIRNDFTMTAYIDVVAENMNELRRVVDGLASQAKHWIRNEQKYEGPTSYSVTADMRYLGQSFEVVVELDSSWIEAGDEVAIKEAFNDAHMKLYGHADRHAIVQIVAVTTIVIGSSQKPVLPIGEYEEREVAPSARLDVFLDHKKQNIALYRREDLPPGATFECPCVIAQSDTTSVVPEGFSGRVDKYNNIILTLGGSDAR